MTLTDTSARDSLYFCSRQACGLQVLGGRRLTNAPNTRFPPRICRSNFRLELQVLCLYQTEAVPRLDLGSGPRSDVRPLL